MPVKTREMPKAAKKRPQRVRKSKQYKEGKQGLSGVKNMLEFVEGEKGLAGQHDNLPAPKRTRPDSETYIKNLMPWQRKMARVKLLGGLSITQLARKFGRSRSMVGKVCASPIFKEYYEMLESGEEFEVANIRMDLKSMALTAVENLDEDLTMRVPTLEHRKVRQVASKDVLDRAGFLKTPTAPSGGGTVNVQMNVIAKMSDDELWAHADKMFRNLRGKK